MIQLVVIIVIIISLVAGIYGIILLSQLRNRFHFDFLNSFFYYHILYFLFGLYGIVGNLTLEQILLKFGLQESTIAGIALIFPLFGIPFIVAAWFLFIKMSAELLNKKLPQYVAICYFILATSAFFIYGRFMQKMPDMDSGAITQKIIIVFYCFDLSISFYFFIVLILNSIKQKGRIKRKYYIRLAFLAIFLASLRAISLQFAGFHWIVGLYFILLFFAGNLSIILLTKVYLLKDVSDYHEINSLIEDIYLKYGISNREKDIIIEICKGKTNQQIADDLFISLQTVKDHIYNIFRKVNIKNRVQLTRIFGK